jgi:hypothetical protein
VSASPPPARSAAARSRPLSIKRTVLGPRGLTWGFRPRGRLTHCRRPATPPERSAVIEDAKAGRAAEVATRTVLKESMQAHSDPGECPITDRIRDTRVGDLRLGKHSRSTAMDARTIT